ncbi:hypothetical protein HDU84_001562 [Entophlyctis sp. JEL0112]|nr:hypothetical protein HDU84_001562 [Entophlyctis sp. JEL0112]
MSADGISPITANEAADSIRLALATILPVVQAASPWISPIFSGIFGRFCVKLTQQQILVATYILENCQVAKSNRSEFLALGDLVARTAVSVANLSESISPAHAHGLESAMKDIQDFIKRHDTAAVDEAHRVHRFTNKVKAIMSAKETQTKIRILEARLVAAGSFLELDLQVRTVTGIDEDTQQLMSYAESLEQKLNEVTLKLDQLTDLSIFTWRQLQSMDQEGIAVTSTAHASASSSLVRVATQKDIVREAQKKVLDAAESAWKRESSLPFNPTIQNWMISSYEVQFDTNDLIGKGGSSAVYKGYINNTPVAVKVFHDVVNNDPDSLEAAISQEVNTWMTISGKPYVLRLIGVCTKVQQPYIVSEYCKTTADKYVRNHPKELYRILYETACGLENIHSAGFIHRDLKPFNILITETNHAAISDFGLSKIAIERFSSSASLSSRTGEIVGTLNWMSPEQRLTPRYTSIKSDIWSFGMVAWELSSGKIPFGEYSEFEIVEALQSDTDRPERPENCDEKLWELIQKCWAKTPGDRPSAKDIRQFFETFFYGWLGSAISKVDWTIFISYCWKNSIEAYDRRQITSDEGCGPCDPRDLSRKLTAIGHICWLDVERTQTGRPLFELLVEGMKHAKLAVICVSKDYANSENWWVKITIREFEFIMELKLPFIIVVVGPEEQFIQAKSKIAQEYADNTFSTIVDAVEDSLNCQSDESFTTTVNSGSSLNQTLPTTAYSGSSIQQGQLLSKTYTSIAATSASRTTYAPMPREMERAHRMSISLAQPSINAPLAEPLRINSTRKANQNALPPVPLTQQPAVISHSGLVPQKVPDAASLLPTKVEDKFQIFLKDAERGQSDAMNLVGNAYQEGDGVNQDFAKAYFWHLKAAMKDHAQSQNNVGHLLRLGQGVEKADPEKAVEWFKKSAENGNADGENSLGFCYLNGIGVPKDAAKAANWFAKAAAKGHVEGLNNYGWALLMGEGVAKNGDRAVECLPVFAKARLPEVQEAKICLDMFIYTDSACKNAMQMLLNGLCPFQLSACQDYIRGKNNLAYMYRNGFGIPQDYGAAVRLYEETANQGDDTGQNGLAYMHLNGLGVTRDVVRAFGLYQKSANQGNSDAQCSLGQMYRNGGGVQKDLFKAFEWYQKSALQNNSDAQNNLGWMYLNGLGIDKSHARAFEWFLKSANQGNAKGQNNVGYMYEFGKGVRRDKRVAVEWQAAQNIPYLMLTHVYRYKKAAAQGLADAIESLRRLSGA